MPSVSIILPIFNRCEFVNNIFTSLKSQTFKEWELIVVDDGSTDDSVGLINQHNQLHQFPITLVQQENAGAAAARNTGIRIAKGDYLAFFDSDDQWDSDHLSQAIETMETHADIDWLYFACRRVDFASGKQVLDSTFYTDGQPNTLFSCAAKQEGDLYWLNNEKAAEAQLFSGIDSGLQNSVVRRRVFEHLSIPEFRVGEDRLLILQVLKYPFQVCFKDKVTVTYMIHEANTSDTNPEQKDVAKRIKAMEQLLTSYEATPKFVELTQNEQIALNRRLAEDYFWKLGYALLLQNNEYGRALTVMRKALRLWPGNVKFWKTYLVTLLKRAFH